MVVLLVFILVQARWPQRPYEKEETREKDRQDVAVLLGKHRPYALQAAQLEGVRRQRAPHDTGPQVEHATFRKKVKIWTFIK